jgi:hypothetical protein
MCCECNAKDLHFCAAPNMKVPTPGHRHTLKLRASNHALSAPKLVEVCKQVLTNSAQAAAPLWSKGGRQS